MTGIFHSEIGSYPAEWSIRRVDSLFGIQQGKSVSKAHRQGDNQKPFLRTKNIYWGRIDFSELDHMHFTTQEESRLKLQVGDLLLCEGGDVGRTAIWNNEIDRCYYQNHLHRLRAKQPDEIDPLFALYWFWFAFSVSKIYLGRSNVTTIPNLSQSKLGELQFPKPDIDEQGRIAHILSTVQNAIAQQERLIELTNELKRVLMKKLFTEGLRGEKQKETEIGFVPESWDVVALGDASEVVMGQSPPGESYNTEGDGVPLINGPVEFGPNPLSLILETKFTTSPTKLCQAGDLILCVRGSTTGRTNVARDKACIGRGVAAICAHGNQDYLNQFIISIREQVYKMGTGTTFPNISGSQIKEIQIPYPPFSEQIEIANILTTIDNKLELVQQKQETLLELFRTLLQQLMTGQIRTKDMDL